MMLYSGPLILTDENYFSHEANVEYMSASQYKDFRTCEAMALAKITGEYVPEPSEALLVGGYVDAHFSGTLAQYRAKHPEIFKRDGGLKSEYIQAENAIQTIERDPFMMSMMQGEQQVIKTGMIGGVLFKARMDFLQRRIRIVDLKYIRDFQPVYVKKKGRMSFVEAWGYDVQGAIYQAVEGNNLPFVLAPVTKEKTPDKAVININQYFLDAALLEVKRFAPHYAAIKRLEVEPVRCETCDYCKATKQLSRIVDYEEFLMGGIEAGEGDDE